MTWGFVAVAAVTVAGSVASGQAANKAANQNQIAGNMNEVAQWGQNASENEAISAANLQNQIRTGYKVGLLNVQQAQAKKKAMQDGFDLSKQVNVVLGAATANAAAAGSVGSSVDAIISDINSKVGDAHAQMDANWVQTTENFNTQLSDLLQQGQDVLKSPNKASVRKTPEAQTSSFGEQLFGAGVQIASSYAMSKMSLGLGTSSPTSGGQLTLAPNSGGLAQSGSFA